ncbi:MAG TPA: hypothetical protein V6C97_11160 [Oculatellaceae cyanobacterium]
MLADNKHELKSMNNEVYHFKVFQSHEDFAHLLGFLHIDREKKNTGMASLRSHELDANGQPINSKSNENLNSSFEGKHINHYRELLERNLPQSKWPI